MVGSILALEDNNIFNFKDFDNEILREYDIRGTVNDNLSVDTAYTLGIKFGSLINANNKKKIVVGYDGRFTSPSLEKALTRGLVESGLNVTLIGLCPTPMLYFAIHFLDMDAGIMITGSHNPPEYNGFKIVLDKRPFYSKKIKELQNVKYYLNPNKGIIKNYNILEHYVERITKNINIQKKLKIAWDTGNGAAGITIKKILEKIKNTENIIINDAVDGSFPSHHPDPTVPKNLIQIQNIVKENNCDIGLAFDGDGDRLGIVDNKTNIVWADKYMILLVEEISKLYKHPPIIMDVKSSKVFFDEIAKMGCQPIMYKTGHSVIKDKMEDLKSPLSGEMSGHVMYKDDFFGFDDAMYVALRFIQILSRKNETLSDIMSKYPKTYSTPETRFNVNESRKFKIVEEILERLSSRNLKVISIDGIRVETKNGWWGIRASNTENALTVRAESVHESELDNMKKNIEYELKLSGVEFKFSA